MFSFKVELRGYLINSGSKPGAVPRVGEGVRGKGRIVFEQLWIVFGYSRDRLGIAFRQLGFACKLKLL